MKRILSFMTLASLLPALSQQNLETRGTSTGKLNFNKQQEQTEPSVVAQPIVNKGVAVELIEVYNDKGTLGKRSMLLSSDKIQNQNPRIVPLGAHFTVQVNLIKPGYLRVYSTNSKGQLWRVYPNVGGCSQLFQPGTYYFPDINQIVDGSIKTVEATTLTPVGDIERVQVQWQTKPFPPAKVEFTQADGQPFAIATRGTELKTLNVHTATKINLPYIVTK